MINSDRKVHLVTLQHKTIRLEHNPGTLYGGKIQGNCKKHMRNVQNLYYANVPKMFGFNLFLK
jgi:hypothetical protein